MEMICEKSPVDCTVQMVPGMLKLKEITSEKKKERKKKRMNDISLVL